MSTSPVAATVSSITLNASTQNVTEFVATANQTTFSITYTPNAILVFLNGILLDNGVDYTATNGTSVVLTNGAAVNDVLTVDKGNYTFSATSVGDPAVAAFKTISVSGQSDVVADSATDTLTLAAGSNMTITTAAGSDTVTLASATVIADDAVTTAKIADDAVGADQLASSAVVTASIVDDAITSAKIADDAITSALIADDAITSALIADDAITSALIADDAITSALIADDAVVQAAIADQAVDEARMQISNAPTNGYFLSAQSGNTGGLTWAEVSAGGAYSDWSIKTGAYTLVAKDQIIVNSASALTMTLPAGSAGSTVIIKATGGGTVTIGRNGSEKINSVAEDATLLSGNGVQLVYVDGTIGWLEI